MVYLINDPMKSDLKTILLKHFAPEIVGRFRFDMEVNTFGRDLDSVRKQMKDQRYIVEVRYKTKEDTWEYICDVFSGWTKKQVEYLLLKYITDKYKAGKIDFDEERSNPDIKKGTFETKEVNT